MRMHEKLGMNRGRADRLPPFWQGWQRELVDCLRQELAQLAIVGQLRTVIGLRSFRFMIFVITGMVMGVAVLPGMVMRVGMSAVGFRIVRFAGARTAAAVTVMMCQR